MRVIIAAMVVRATEIRLTNLQNNDRSSDEDLKRSTPADRLQMMWQLTLDAWAFKGDTVAELRLPRHIVRVLRSEG